MSDIFDPRPRGAPMRTLSDLTAKYGDRLSENVSYGPPLTGSSFMAMTRDPRAEQLLSRGPLETTGPLHPMHYPDARWPLRSEGPDQAATRPTIADQMRFAPALEEIGSLLDRPSQPATDYPEHHWEAAGWLFDPQMLGGDSGD